ncbi:hypothetical protein [Paenibacillus sp. RU4T]|uniref:hypothetical protein n=1 Tax=Paenibacillus sp. RU4T TaxID=1907394 RepID=UPI000970F3CB|nr:hypothetical protein [Paenibacillus sp. RU4T]
MFSNIKLEIPRAMTLAELEEALDAIMDGRNCERSEVPAGRTIHVAWDRNGKWLTIYDEGIEAGDWDELDGMTAQLSLRAGTYAVSNAVLDGKLLRMRLFEQGRAADLFISDPELYNGMTGQRRQRKGQLSKWLPLQQEGPDKPGLAEIWEREEAVAEDTLAALAGAFGWSAAASGMGLPEWEEMGQDHAPAVLRLHFRDRDPA